MKYWDWCSRTTFVTLLAILFFPYPQFFFQIIFLQYFNARCHSLIHSFCLEKVRKCNPLMNNKKIIMNINNPSRDSKYILNVITINPISQGVSISPPLGNQERSCFRPHVGIQKFKIFRNWAHMQKIEQKSQKWSEISRLQNV